MTRNAPPTRARLRAFGLIEVLLSASMLAVAMSGTLGLVRQLEETYAHQRRLVQALHIAEAHVEELLVRNLGDQDLDDGAHTGASYDLQGKPGGTFFTTSWQINNGVPVDGTRELIFRVSWQERGQTKKIELRTVRT